MFSYNTQVHKSTLQTPFYLTFLHLLNMPFFNIDVPATKYSDSWPTEAFLQMQTAYKLAKENNLEANQRMKERFDRKTKERTFEVGDTVMISYPPNTPQAGRHWQQKVRTNMETELQSHQKIGTPHIQSPAYSAFPSYDSECGQNAIATSGEKCATTCTY
jgi:hypothetical protein